MCSNMDVFVYFLIVCVLRVSSTQPENQSVYQQDLDRACSIYCTGDVLSTIQLSGIYNDSKTFVDMPMKFDPEDVQINFNSIVNKSDTAQLMQFMDENFFPVGSDLNEWIPSDFQANPPFIASIANEDYREWASDINQLWTVLGRQVNDSVLENPQRHSFVPLRYPMMVPGGRFRESYYWDSWWILKGLLVCNMSKTAMNIVNILLDEIEFYGFVPNGARIYYTDRSQPPVISEMIRDMCLYYGWQSEESLSLLQDTFHWLEVEYDWWMNPANLHLVQLTKTYSSNGVDSTMLFKLNQYHSNGTTPRPESYLEDTLAGNGSIFWNNVRSGAETGWDFSSRWIGAPHTNMSDITTTEIVPVELNAILYRYERNMFAFQALMVDMGVINPDTGVISGTNYSVSHNLDYYDVAARNRSVAMNQILWDDSLNAWNDYNLTSGQLNTNGITSISSFIPLWAGLLDGWSADSKLATLDSFINSGLHQVGGILTTTFDSSQQWDAPNAWPPLVWFTIEGLIRLDLEESINLARNISAQWLETGYMAYNATGYMYEKYNAFEVGVGGGGGEYVPQIGFGWTNGVALYLLNHSIPQTVVVEANDDTHANDVGLIVALVLCFLVAMMLVFYLTKRQFSNKDTFVCFRNDAGQSEFYSTTASVRIETTENAILGDALESEDGSTRETTSAGISLHSF